MSPPWSLWGPSPAEREIFLSPLTFAARVQDTHLHNIKPLLPVSITFSPYLPYQAFPELCVRSERGG